MTERCCLTKSPYGVFSVLSALSALSAPLPAQTIRATGRVVNADSVPVRGIRVVLHRIGQRIQGPVDSTRSDATGRFAFRFHPDTSSFYLVSGRYAGIEYFSPPLPTNPARADSSALIVVYDTSGTAPVSLEARHIVVARPGEDGSRGILDLIILRNGGRFTRVASDTLRGSWSVALPHGTRGLQISESDLSAEAVSRRGDSLIVTAALAPGEKQITAQYQLPAGDELLELPVMGAGVPLNVMVEEPGAQVVGLAPADSQVIQGRSFRRWTGTAMPSRVVRIILPGAVRVPRWILPVLVAGLALGLIGAGWRAGRRIHTAVMSPDELVNAIAALDLRYLGREDSTSTAEWSSYQAERARLKGQLQASLAASPGNR